MPKFSLALIIYTISALFVLAFDLFDIPSRTTLQIVVILLGIILVLVNGYYFTPVNSFFRREGKFYLLYLCTLFVQLLVFATGGLYSPFFVLIYLSVLAISFLAEFYFVLLFLASTATILLTNLLLNQEVILFFLEDPGTPIIYMVSFIGIVPLAYLLAYRYHLKDSIAEILKNQINVEETILATLDELVFVINRDTVILSVNDAVEHTLSRSRSELLHKPLFDVLFLKDKNGNLTTKNIFPFDKIIAQRSTEIIEDLTLLTTDIKSTQAVTVKVKPIADLDSAINQFSIILNITPKGQPGGIIPAEHKELEEANAKHQAMIEDLKHRLLERGLQDLKGRLVLVAKTQEDILTARSIEDHGIYEQKTYVDIASLCRQTLVVEHEFAQALHVSLDFSLPHFGADDVKPLLSGRFVISPEHLTGPFFTVPCDIKLISLAIQKLIDIGIMLASGESNALVQTTVLREEKQAILVTITANCPLLTTEEKDAIFIAYYGSLDEKTNLRFGSGLEGYLVKLILTKLQINVLTHYMPEQKRISFTLRLPKGSNIAAGQQTN
ncbi:MAG: PAS domain-containing protein [Candidatus Levybacteria bacterium]|nr:PAS domain-containing protein [Candidatus Levybacteria bacterium]